MSEGGGGKHTLLLGKVNGILLGSERKSGALNVIRPCLLHQRYYPKKLKANKSPTSLPNPSMGFPSARRREGRPSQDASGSPLLHRSASYSG
jgi:hypothetical protein